MTKEGKTPRYALDRALRLAEARLGVIPTGLLAGGLLLLCAMAVSAPNLKTTDWGIQYEAMSVAPFNAAGRDVQLRFLTPLIAHVLFFRGDAYVYFPHLVGAIFLGFVYVYGRRERIGPSGSLGLSAAMATSTTVLSTFAMAGYTDTTSYLLVLWALMTIKKWLWPAFLGLAILNHESCIFAVPPLLLLFLTTKSTPKKTKWLGVACLTLCVSIAFAIRAWLETRGEVSLTSDYYLSIGNVRKCLNLIKETVGVGVFHAFKLLWIAPVLASVWSLKHGRSRAELVFIWISILCAMAQLILAVDVSRLLGLAFPAILVSCVMLHAAQGPAFVRRIWLIVACNACIPDVIVVANYIIPRPSLPGVWLQKLVQLLPGP